MFSSKFFSRIRPRICYNPLVSLPVPLALTGPHASTGQGDWRLTRTSFPGCICHAMGTLTNNSWISLTHPEYFLVPQQWVTNVHCSIQPNPDVHATTEIRTLQPKKFFSISLLPSGENAIGLTKKLMYPLVNFTLGGVQKEK